MANAMEVAFGWTPKEVPAPVVKAEALHKQRPKSRSQAAVEWIQLTGSSQRQAARKFSLTQAAISLRLKYNRETCYCPACHRKLPFKRYSRMSST